MRPGCIILLTGLLFTCRTNAQTLMLRDTSGNPVNNGDTILVSGTTNDFMLTGYIYVFNSSAITKDVQVQKEHLYLVPGTDTYFAWYINMYNASTFLSVDPAPIPAGGTDQSFSGWYNIQGFAGTSFVRYKFFDENNIADSAWVVFEYNVQLAAGIAQPNDLNELSLYPNPVKGVFFFAPHPAFSDYFIEVYSVQGLMVQKQNFMAPALASMDISGQKPGIYFVKLSDGEKTILKKFVKE